MRRAPVELRERLLQMFRTDAGPVEIGLRRSGDDYAFLTLIGPNRYLVFHWKQKTFGAYTLHLLDTWGVEQPLIAVAGTDASVVHTGTWGVSSTATNTPGDFLTWTTPAAVTTGAVGIQRAQNAAIWAFDIDGDRTAATELPTAQNLVDNGTIPASALTTGGGTLQPDQRVFDGYQAGSAQTEVLLLAADLAPGVHAVKVTLTPYANAAAVGPRLAHFGMYSGGTATTRETPGAAMTEIASLYPSPSGQNAEYAIRAWPTDIVLSDPTNASIQFVGNNHGSDEELSVAFVMDGSTVAPGDGATVWGEELLVHRTTKLHHMDLVAPEYLADILTTYALRGFGMTITNRITWAYGSIRTSSAYLSMFSLGSRFTRCTTLGHGADELLTLDDDGVRALEKSPLALAWEEPGHWAAAMALMTLEGVDRWRRGATAGLWIQDRSDPKINKMYAQRDHGIEDVVAGTVWHSAARYIAQWFVDPQAAFSELPAY